MTKREVNFIKNYLKTGNASLSAREAGYSIKSASSIGYQLKNKPEIKKLLDENMLVFDLRSGQLIKELIELKTSTSDELVKAYILSFLYSMKTYDSYSAKYLDLFEGSPIEY